MDNLKWISFKKQKLFAIIPFFGGASILMLTYWLLFFNRSKMGNKGGIIYTFIFFPIFIFSTVGISILLDELVKTKTLSIILTLSFLFIAFYIAAWFAITYQEHRIKKYLNK